MTLPSQPKFTVIVPVFNDATRLALCLAALDRQTYAGSFEVIVADNGSTDDVASVVAAHPRFRLVVEPKPGSYAARNLAASQATGDWFAFTDADCIPDPDWLAEAAARIADDPSADLLVGEISMFDEDPNGHPYPEVAAYEKVNTFRQRYYAEVVGYGATANILVRRSVFEAVEGFDATRRSLGDRDFGLRVTAAGYRLVYTPEAVVAHPFRADPVALEGKIRRMVGGEHVADRGRWHLVLWAWLRYLLLRPGRAVLLVLRHPDLSGPERWAALRMIPRIAWWQASERARLMGGAEPRR